MSDKKLRKKGHKSKNIRYDSDEAVRAALIEIFIFICFLTVTTIVTLSVRHLYMFYFNDTMEKLFLNRDTSTLTNQSVSFDNLVTTSDWWDYLETNFLDDLHNDEEEQATGRVFLLQNILLGPPRLRQIRVLEGTCEVHEIFNKYFDKCYAAYSSCIEDQRADFKGTKFHTVNDLNTYSIWGEITSYKGGGYVKDLTYEHEKNIAILDGLKSQHWVDRGTRVVVMEFGLYNGNTNLFVNAKFIAELPPTGGIKTTSQMQALKLHSVWTEQDYVVFVAAVLFYLMVLFYTIEEIRELFKTGISHYVRSIWNLLDFTILIMAYISFAYNIWHPSYLKNVLDNANANPNKFQSLDVICYWNRCFIDMVGILAFFVWIKIFKFISFNKTMLQFSTTLRRCAKDLLGFGVMFFIVFLAYAQLGLLLFGTKHPDFRNFKESILTLMRMVLGDFEYAAIEQANRTLGPIYFLTYILLVFFILLNMFLAIINDSYSAVKSEITAGRNHLQAFIARMLRNLFNLLCKCKPIPKKREEPADKDDMPQDVVSEASIYPKTSTTTAPEREPVALRQSYILREYFEEIHQQGQTPQDSEQLKRLTNRVSLLEDVLEQLVGNMDLILKKVDSKKRQTKIK